MATSMKNDGGLYAHELGHNGRCNERSGGSGASGYELFAGNMIPIMVQVPGSMERQLMRAKERDLVLQWVYP